MRATGCQNPVGSMRSSGESLRPWRLQTALSSEKSLILMEFSELTGCAEHR